MYRSEVNTKTRVAGRTTGITVSTRPRRKQAGGHISFSGVDIAYLLHKRWSDGDGNEKAKCLYLISLYRPTLVYDDRKSLDLGRLPTIARKYGPYRELNFMEDQCSLVILQTNCCIPYKIRGISTRFVGIYKWHCILLSV